MRLLLHSGGLDSHICWLMDRDRVPVYVEHGSGNAAREVVQLQKLAAYHEGDVQPFVYKRILAADLRRHVLADGHIAHRNAYLILSAAVALPAATEVAYGALRGEGSADKSPAFVRAMTRLLTASEGRPVTVAAPLLHMTKGQALAHARTLDGFGALEVTWSCYHDGPEPCGRCQACYRRHLAEWAAGLRTDPPPRLPTETFGPWATLRRTPLRRWPSLAAANTTAVRAMLANRRSRK